MATPTITPPPPIPPQAPPPPAPRRRSFAGPVVLISIGVLFLLGNMGVLDKYTLFSGFAKYWPLLLILWGVIKLVENWNAQREGYRSSGIGAGGVVLIIFVIILGSAATGIMRFGPELQGNIDVDGNDVPFFPLFGNKYTFTDNNSAAFPAGGSIRVVNERGNVKLTASSDDRVHVVTNYVVIARNLSDANNIRGARVPVFTNEGSILDLSSTGTKGVDNADKASVNIEVQVPRKASAEVQTLRGDVRVIGRDGDVKLSTSRGDAQVEDVNGKAEVHLRHGDFDARKVSGDLSVEGRVDDCNVADIGGQVELRGDYFGSINVSRVPKPVRFSSSRTNLEIAKLDGDMRMESGDLRISSMSGPVTLRTRSKDIHFDSLTGDLTLDDSNGEVEVHVSKLPVGNIDITNRNGQVRLTLPDKGSFSLDAETRNGEVRSDFGEIRTENVRDTNHASGKVGTGGGTIRLRTEHGDIEIRKTSMQPPTP
ncbi:MAG: DUF4097 family beta strand repeat protein [Candidatus Koribacter versatilis]|uniref:DUF4097 family beta strand repeat protein n=1 Tax=Candidatus Korobacter versatilis TaxID=658062 RepID=A0A932EQJ4_9BACT|nr:DUF4097 family beta strand repeat protein [Candidatus Koribacter versatilis]